MLRKQRLIRSGRHVSAASVQNKDPKDFLLKKDSQGL